MRVPLSLPRVVVERSFHAANRGLGVRPEDVDVFLAACESENLAVSSWELWLADHRPAFGGDPIPQVGQCCDLIPVEGSRIAATFSFHVSERSGDEAWPTFMRRSVAETCTAIWRFIGESHVPLKWRAHIRFNFRLEAQSGR